MVLQSRVCKWFLPWLVLTPCFTVIGSGLPVSSDVVVAWNHIPRIFMPPHSQHAI